MPVTQPRQFRLTDAELEGLDALASRWGPVKPLSRTEVIRELIRREMGRARRRAGREGGPVKSALLALACLAGLAGRVDAGTITYTYHNTEMYDPGVGMLVVDEAALFRGEILSRDVERFQFDFQFRIQDLAPLDIPISTATGLPLAGGTLAARREVVPGTFARMTGGIGADGSGYWQSSTPGSHDLFGAGYWSVDIVIAPEPSGLALARVALACAGVGLGWRARRRGGSARA